MTGTHILPRHENCIVSDRVAFCTSKELWPTVSYLTLSKPQNLLALAYRRLVTPIPFTMTCKCDVVWSFSTNA